MFDDPQKELKRLEEQLLAEEDSDWLDNELEAMHRLLGDEPKKADMDETRVYRNFANGYGEQIRNFANGYGEGQPSGRVDDEQTDSELDTYSDQVPEPEKKKSAAGLVILACLETLGILAIIAYWLLVLLK
jgi:hypothetical protein